MKKRKLLTALLICTAISLQANAKEYSGETYDNHSGYVGGVISIGTQTPEKYTFKECTFTNNKAATAGAIGNYSPVGVEILNSTFKSNNSTDVDDGGGAIFAGSESVTYINGSTFINNTTNAGGGAIATRGSNYYTNGKEVNNSSAKLDIINSTFTGNKALESNSGNGGNGGAIYNTFYHSQTNEDSATIIGSTFTDNEAINGGAVYNSEYQDKNSSVVSAVIDNNTFSGNSATKNGGAIYNAADLQVSNSNFNTNSAVMGGGIYNKSVGTVKVADTSFNGNTADWGGGIAHASSGTLNVTNTAFESNKATVQGGAIVSLRHNTNKDSIVLNVENAQFKGNEAGAEGGAIWSGSKTTITNSIFDSNKTTGTTLSEIPNYNTDDEGGGAVFVGSNSVTSITGSTFTNNQSGTVGGAIATRSNAKNDGTTTLDIVSSNFDGNKASVNGGAIATYIDSTVTDTSFTNNSAGSKGGAVWTNQNLTVNAVNSNIVMSGNKATDGGDIFMNKEGANLNMNAAEGKSITVASGISGNENGYNMNVNAGEGATGSLILDSAVQNATIAVNAGTFQLGQNATLVDSHLTMATGSTFSSINGKIDSADTMAYGNSSVTFEDGTNIAADVNIGNGTADNFTGADVQGKVTITDINTIGDTTANGVSINLAEALGIDPNNMAISEALQNQTQRILTPIRYLQGGVSETGMLTMAPTGNGYKDFNPAVMASPVAAQLGGYLTQLNSYDQAFRNMDMYMLMTKKQREAMKLRNKYAAADGNLIFDPTGSAYDDKAVWVRPYATFENVPLKNGPKVSNVAYGSFFGADSELYDLGHGWDGMISVYAGYNGSHQAYDGIGIYQNGGTLGLVGMAYKGNFFTGLTVNAGANVGEANTAYGTDNFTMLMAGIANKTGYNIELADGKFIIQPNVQLSYSFVNTFDYTNAAGVHMNSDPLNAIQVEPGIKFIGNLKNGWQPYAGVSVVWNIMDKTNFNANNVSLPELSVKPYVRYGVGVRKTWGEVCTGFFQTYFTNGGRNGVGLQAGFRFTLGKGGLSSIKSSNNMPELPKTQINLSSAR